MLVFEISNLTMKPENTTQFLVVPDREQSEGTIHYPITFPRLDKVWVSKDVAIHTVEKVLPYVDVWGGQTEYDTMTDIRKDTLYRLWEEGELKTLYLNRRMYSSAEATVLIGDATILVSESGVLITDILDTDARIIIDTPLIGSIGDAVEIPTT